jgi:hypothetical protein
MDKHGVNFITTELVATDAWNHGNRLREIIPFYGRKIQVSEI